MKAAMTTPHDSTRPEVAQRRDVEAKPIQVGLLGIGTVGSGTFKVLQRNQAEIRGRAGRGIVISMVADLDVERARAVVGPDVQVVADGQAIIDNPEIDIVIELIGGYGIAKKR